jgi:hypothetical protein
MCVLFGACYFLLLPLILWVHMEAIIYPSNWQMFSIKGQILNMLAFVSHVTSIVVT